MDKDELVRLLNGIVTTLRKSSLSSIDDAKKGLNEIIENLNKESDTKLSDFVKQVGDGLIDAQAHLDMRRTKAAGETTILRIPKATAQISFEVSQSSSKGFNILFASRKSQESENLQQKLDFEIVAVPLVDDSAMPTPEDDLRNWLGSIAEDEAAIETRRQLVELLPDRDSAKPDYFLVRRSGKSKMLLVVPKKNAGPASTLQAYKLTNKIEIVSLSEVNGLIEVLGKLTD